MKHFISSVVKYSVKRHWFSPEDESWLQACLEKWISAILGMGLLLAVGLLLFPAVPTVTFIASILFLRQRTSGFRVKSKLGGLAVFLLLELAALGMVYPVLTRSAAATVLAISGSLAFVLSPFRHPDFPMTDQEFYANDIGSKVRLLILMVLAGISIWANGLDCLYGITLGVALDAASLALAHLQNCFKERSDQQ